MRVEYGEVSVRTSSRFEVVDVTSEVRAWLRGIRAAEGLLIIRVPHTTAAVTINEAEPGLMEDIVEAVKRIAPPEHAWRHNRIDDNAHAHIAASLIGDSRVVPVRGGDLATGTWQRIMLVEMDGPRSRRIQLLYLGS